jgi:hypothetical protein
MSYKELLSAVAIAITFVAYVPYIRLIIKGTVKPHIFSWVIWGTTTFVVFLAQLADHGGAGAWPIGVSGVITIGIALLAYIKRADVRITKTDWLFFAAAMASLPFWYFTSDPLWAVVILTTVDVFGFGPTLRKVYAHPHSESLLFALENYSVTTLLFPAVTAVACLLLIAMAASRRRLSAARS